jgi:uncharacterized membrane protein
MPFKRGPHVGQMQRARRMRAAALSALAALFLVVAPPAAADFKSCAPVRDVFEGTRYAGSDLYRIRAQAVSCRTARRVARRGTYKAAAAVPDSTGHVRVDYRGWRIVDDLRGDVDRFRARASGRKRVRWLWGDI